MAKATSRELGLAIFLMRTVRGWSQTEMARAAGVTSSMLSEFERGRRNPSPKTLERLSKASGVPLSAIEAILPALRSLQKSVEGGVVERSARRQIAEERIEAVTESLVRATLELVFKGRQEPQTDLTPPRPEDREEAPGLWARLQSLEPESRSLAVEEGEEYWKWALCELICHESTKLVRMSPGRAAELAGLAVTIAQRVPGPDAWRSHLRGYAWAHLGNACRAGGNRQGAEEAFLRAGLLWRVGDGFDLLDESRMRAIDESLVRTESGSAD
ncbi:MAG TPA: helix-turn-helix transcriptional regulator [Thermoanaerobaculia bacterium]